MKQIIAEKFLGKVCTIITNSSAIPLKDGIQHSQYFTGEVYRIDDFGIWLKHLQTGTSSLFFFPVIGIVEEQVIPPNDARHEKIKKEMEMKEMAKKPQVKSDLISVEELTAKLNKTKKIAS